MAKKFCIILSRDNETWSGEYVSRLGNSKRSRSYYTESIHAAAKFASEQEALAKAKKGAVFADGSGSEHVVEVL